MSISRYSNVFILCRSKRSPVSASGKLCTAINELGLDTYRVTADYVPKHRVEDASIILNYGVSKPPIWMGRTRGAIWYNDITTVRDSADKLRMFGCFNYHGVPCLDNTMEEEEAMAWIQQGHQVVCRTLVGAARGRGIVIARSADTLVPAELYTKFFGGHRVREYRVYIVDGNAIDVTEKRRRGRGWYDDHDLDRDDYVLQTVRTNGNGWVYARNTMEASPMELNRISRVAEQAAASINLGMGCVDIIVNRTDDGELNEVLAVETNTSVGLDGTTTLRNFSNAIVNSIWEKVDERQSA